MHDLPRSTDSSALLRYPRTLHLQGSRAQADDDKTVQSLRGLQGRSVVIEEKLDGANCGLSFSPAGELLLQSRGHFLVGGGRERQFAPLHAWARAHEVAFLARLEDRYVMYGEWMHAKHSVFYDHLPHLFLEFDVWDRCQQRFLSTSARQQLLMGLPVISVPVLYQGPMLTHPGTLQALLKPSLAKTPQWRDSLAEAVQRHDHDLDLTWRQTDRSDLAEGLYLKVEDDEQVHGRFKWVRQDFVQTIFDSGTHHSERPLLPNRLAPGVDLFAPTCTRTWEPWPVGRDGS